MALTERSRSALYRGLSEVLHDEEAVGEMLSYFPARDVDEPASRDFVDARIAHVESRFVALDARMEVGFASTDARFSELETRMEARFSSVEARMEAGFLATEARFSSVEARMEAGLSSLEARMDARSSSLEARMEAGFSASDARMDAGLADFRGEVVAAMHAEIRTMTQWTVGSIVAVVGLLVALGLIR